jgi:hypothetical protein
MLIENRSYNINWKAFKVGTSFFVPCLDGGKTKKVIQSVTKRLKVNVLMQIVIESGVRGVRVWRI